MNSAIRIHFELVLRAKILVHFKNHSLKLILKNNLNDDQFAFNFGSILAFCVSKKMLSLFCKFWYIVHWWWPLKEPVSSKIVEAQGFTYSIIATIWAILAEELRVPEKNCRKGFYFDHHLHDIALLFGAFCHGILNITWKGVIFRSQGTLIILIAKNDKFNIDFNRHLIHSCKSLEHT